MKATMLPNTARSSFHDGTVRAARTAPATIRIPSSPMAVQVRQAGAAAPAAAGRRPASNAIASSHAAPSDGR